MERAAVRIKVPFDVLDLGTAGEFLRWILARLDRDTPPPVDVVLDFVDVEFVMAAGVQALLDLETVLGQRGQTLRVADAAPIVARVFDICGVATRWITP